MKDLAEVLEPILIDAWPATDVERYDGWLLRAAEGYTSRANSVHVVAESRLPVASLLQYGLDWYRARRLPLRFRLHDSGLSHVLDADLGEEFVRSPSVETMWRPVDAVEDRALVAARHPNSAWLAAKEALGGYRSGPAGRWEKIVSAIDTPKLFGSIAVGGHVVSTGMAVVSGDWVGIFEVVVHPDHRRRGIGTDLVASLLADAAVLGVTRAYLQVEETNEAALAMYRHMGFVAGYRYWYRTLSGRADVSSLPCDGG